LPIAEFFDTGNQRQLIKNGSGRGRGYWLEAVAGERQVISDIFQLSLLHKSQRNIYN
jgi:hypothetical protein